MVHHIPKIAYLLVAVTALGFPLMLVLMWWVTQVLGVDIPILYLAIGALLVTGIADLFLAPANERFNKQPDAGLYQRNALVGDEAIVLDGFTSGETTTLSRVRLQGQIWTAQCAEGELLKSGQRVRVTDRQGLTLVFTPVL